MRTRLGLIFKSFYQFNHPDFSSSISMRQPVLPLAVLVILIWYLINPISILAMALTALLLVWFCAYFWARQLATHVSGTRKLTYAALQVGDELEEHITLQNTSWLPVLWAEYIDRSNIPGYAVTSARAADPHSLLEWRAHTICSKRGVFLLGPWELFMGDPLGIFQIHQIYHQPHEILVYPPQALLPNNLLPHRSTSGEHRPLRQPLMAETINALASRPFQPGDPLRRIHWPTTAKRNEPFVKQFEPEASSTFWLVPDLDAAVQLGSGQDSTFETLVLLLASLSSSLIKSQIAVGLITGGEELYAVTPQRSQTHLWALLRAIAPLEPIPNRPFSNTLQRLPTLVPWRDTLVLLTPSSNLDWTKALNLPGKGITPGRAKVILLDPLSFGGATSAETMQTLLSGQGIDTSLVHRGEIQPLTGIYGQINRWEFSTGGTGRLFVRHTPKRL
jgi:uncharacterized protein (DUF58 family)